MVKKINIKKFIEIILIVFIAINIMTPIVKAGSTGEIISGVKGFENAREDYVVDGTHKDMEFDEEDTTDPTTRETRPGLKTISSTIYNTLLTIGIVVAVIVGLVIAMKFMTGSIEQKAQVKETLIPYITGCIVIFGAFGIWRLVLNILNQTM